MAYELKPDQKVQKQIRKVARKQIDEAIAAIDDASAHEAVHELRKRMKKVRGVLRLVRPALGNYSKENGYFRDLAAVFSEARDHKQMVEAFVETRAHFQRAPIDPEIWHRTQTRLEERLERCVDERALEERLVEAKDELADGKKRVDDWKLEDDGFEAVAAGLEQTYGRARDALAKAKKTPTVACFHELRKQAKYHRYHLELLRRIWPEMVLARRDEAEAMESVLGHDHDLALLREVLEAEIDDHGEQELFSGLLARDSERCRDEAIARGEKLFKEKPSLLSSRYACLWRAAS